MARSIHRLKQISLSRKLDPGYHGDGGGLYLQVTEPDSKSWIFRFSLAGKRREMGLGPYPAVTLAAARTAATEARSLVKAGKDPIAARGAERARQRLEEARGVTFDQAVEQFMETHEDGWRSAKHRQQWRNTLKAYASPALGHLAVALIGTAEVTRVLDPIWKKKPETASRLRGRIERILDWSKVRGYRDGENPARWRGHLDKVFPTRAKLRQIQHHAAVPIDDMPALYGKLYKASGTAPKALRFAILTAARAGEVMQAKWSEIDLKDGIWSIPAERMKAGRLHRVALSQDAVAILKEMAELRAGELVFPGQRAKRPISLSSLSKALTVAGGGDATTHGCRSTFKDWASERTSFPREVSEMALAHAIGDKVEAAYRRGELMEKRRALMQQWATFLTTGSKGKVVPIGSRRAAG